MDFHSLSRKELQGLCKKNKIPANMTNLAMADALAALDKVEGLDEVLNLPTSEPQQSPPRTACRSTRRKPVLAEPESSQTLTRTRRATRRTVANDEAADHETKNVSAEGGDQENVNANLLETPGLLSGRTRGRAVSVRKKTQVSFVEGLVETIVGEEKKKFLDTPAAVEGSRRRCVDAGSRRNIETKNAEKSTVRVYSTRRSVRLLEQSMEELSLKEKEITAVVEDDGCCKETEEAEEKKEDASGIDMTVTVQSSGNNGDSELCQNLAKSMDNASEMKPEVVEAKVDAADCCSEAAGEGSVEKFSLSEEQVSEEQELGEENKGNESESDDACEQEGSVENFSVSEEQVSEEQELGEENKGNESESDDACEQEGSVENFSVSEEQVSEEVPMEQELGEENKGNESQEITSENGDHWVIVSGVDEEYEKVGVQDVADESTGKNPDALEIDGAKENLNEVDVLESENTEDATTDNINESGGENEPEVLCPEVYDTKVEEEECGANEMLQVQEDVEDPEKVQQQSPLSPQCLNSETPSVECDDEEVLVDISVVEDDNFVVPCLHKTPAPANQVSLSGDAEGQTLSDIHVEQAAELCAALVPASPMEKLPAAKYSSPYRPLVSGGGIARSPFADGTIQSQFPRPAGSATRKSAMKKQIKPDMADAIDLVDKENIISLKMEEPKKEEKVKFNDMSLRQLKKMFKGMTIDNKKNAEEENNGTKVENKRVALQALPDN